MEKMSSLLVKVCHEKRKSKDVKLHSTPGIVHMPRGAEKNQREKCLSLCRSLILEGACERALALNPLPGCGHMPALGKIPSEKNLHH
jgi:hypothetical protein